KPFSRDSLLKSIKTIFAAADSALAS
ncbi:MAG: hypothetical protein ACI9KE_005624, partial [Polyangiales bacterium]